LDKKIIGYTKTNNKLLLGVHKDFLSATIALQQGSLGLIKDRNN
jgi:hypothetical protein